MAMKNFMRRLSNNGDEDRRSTDYDNDYYDSGYDEEDTEDIDELYQPEPANERRRPAAGTRSTAPRETTARRRPQPVRRPAYEEEAFEDDDDYIDADRGDDDGAQMYVPKKRPGTSARSTYDEPDEIEDQAEEVAEPKQPVAPPKAPAAPQPQPKPQPKFRGVVHMAPTSYRECRQSIVDDLRDSQVVFLHIMKLERAELVNLLEYLQGAVYALGASIFKGDSTTVVLLPAGVKAEDVIKRKPRVETPAEEDAYDRSSDEDDEI